MVTILYPLKIWTLENTFVSYKRICSRKNTSFK